MTEPKKQTLNKDGTPRRSGSGRKENSFSFTPITLKQLNEMFKDENVKIPVYAKWAATIGFNLEPQAAKNMQGTIIGRPAEEMASIIKRPDEAPGFKVIDFNED